MMVSHLLEATPVPPSDDDMTEEEEVVELSLDIRGFYWILKEAVKKLKNEAQYAAQGCGSSHAPYPHSDSF